MYKKNIIFLIVDLFIFGRTRALAARAHFPGNPHLFKILFFQNNFGSFARYSLLPKAFRWFYVFFNSKGNSTLIRFNFILPLKRNPLVLTEKLSKTYTVFSKFVYVNFLFLYYTQLEFARCKLDQIIVFELQFLLIILKLYAVFETIYRS